MAVTLITGPANAGKAQIVIEAVRGALAHGYEPLLVVPTRADVEHYLRELAGAEVAMGVRVERFDGLIEEIVRRAGAGEQALGALARQQLLVAIVERAGAQRASPGLIRGLGALFAELQVRRVSASRLRRALAQWSETDGAAVSRAELGEWFAQYRESLERLGRVDAEQRAVRALDRLRRSPALWGTTPLAVYGFDDLTPLQLDTIETLGRIVGAPVTVSLTYEPGRAAFAGRAATFEQLRPIAETHRAVKARATYYVPRARQALSHLERSLFETEVVRVEPGDAVRLLEGGGERAELELVARDIAELLADGMAAEDIAVVVRSPAQSADLLSEVFSAAAIPHACERRRTLADTAVGGALVGLLRCLPRGDGTPSQGTLNDLLAWLRAPGVLTQPELADSLETRARRLGVLGADAARALWEERHWRLEAIDHLGEAAERGPAALAERASRELMWLFSAPRRGSAAVLDEHETDEARALSAGRAALGELRDLARVAPELAPADGDALARVLARVEVFAGARPSPGTVAVLDPLALRARRVKALFLCCLQEGVFPARARPQPVLGEEERRRLAETSGLRLGEHEDLLAAERYLMYAAVSRPEQLLVLSWHVADDDGEPTSRSLFLDDVCDLFTESLSEQRLRRPLGAAESRASAADALGSSAEVRSPSPWRLTDPSLLEELRERPWSPSSLESWIGCPMRWFVANLLRPGAFEPEPEPLVQGGLAHAALHETFDGLREQTGSARLTHSKLELARRLLRASLERNEIGFPLSVAPERRPGARRRLTANLERYLEYAAEAESPLEPTYLEVGFGIEAHDQRGAASELPAFEFAPGARLRGRIDRIDVGETGEAVVYDYKSSFAPAPAKWVAEGRLQIALYMRVVEALLELPVAGGFFQPLSRELRARGVLDADGGIELDCVRGDTRPREDLDALLDEALTAAREAAAQAARGEIEPRPQSCAYGKKGCEFPTICRCER